ncbi:hypothetical protein QGN31_06525 [Mycobacterium sp. 2-64]|uniref:hypothetical protein n=1 Tax=Mycobacterium sp. 2-64 TaxID=3042319 RepID=UPI002DDAA4C1|nr:hypothetical protein [Mycobacterium sp. 2-64]WSE52718.1 hypothetical protein QGN31_06525 [Mycobacterium sp. 2-64]
MNTVGIQHNAESCRHSQDRASPAVTRTATDEQLDAAILAVLGEAAGNVVPWAELRDRLPTAPYWAKVRALVRLHQSGKLCAFKVRGRTYVDPIVVVA